MIRTIIGGSFQNTERFLRRILETELLTGVESQCQRGVLALQQATPEDSGKTSESWYFEIERAGDVTTVWWLNSNVNEGFNVAIGLQYGHGTGTGGWVQGYDYINPALKPIFDEIAEAIWREVQNS